MNLDDFKSNGTHLIAWYVDNNNVTYFASSGAEYNPKRI